MTAAPAAAVLLAALPVLAVPAQGFPRDLADARLPGLEQMRVAIPEGAVGEHSLTVYEVRSVLPPRMALSEVERHWRRLGADVVLQARSGDWHVLSQRLDDRAGVRDGMVAGDEPGRADALPSGFETLQLRARPGGGSTGLLTRWFRPESAPERDDGAGWHPDALHGLLPADADGLRRFASNDPDGRRGSTLAAHLDQDLDRAETRIDRHLRRLGFLPMTTGDDPRALHWRDDRARFYRDGVRELLVTLHREPDGTGVVLHLMEKVP